VGENPTGRKGGAQLKTRGLGRAARKTKMENLRRATLDRTARLRPIFKNSRENGKTRKGENCFQTILSSKKISKKLVDERHDIQQRRTPPQSEWRHSHRNQKDAKGELGSTGKIPSYQKSSEEGFIRVKKKTKKGSRINGGD